MLTSEKMSNGKNKETILKLQGMSTRYSSCKCRGCTTHKPLENREGFWWFVSLFLLLLSNLQDSKFSKEVVCTSLVQTTYTLNSTYTSILHNTLNAHGVQVKLEVERKYQCTSTWWYIHCTMQTLQINGCILLFHPGRDQNLVSPCLISQFGTFHIFLLQNQNKIHSSYCLLVVLINNTYE